jgi:hypothetical protein
MVIAIKSKPATAKPRPDQKRQFTPIRVFIDRSISLGQVHTGRILETIKHARI